MEECRPLDCDRSMATLVCSHVIKIKHSSYHILWKKRIHPDIPTQEQQRRAALGFCPASGFKGDTGVQLSISFQWASRTGKQVKFKFIFMQALHCNTVTLSMGMDFVHLSVFLCVFVLWIDSCALYFVHLQSFSLFCRLAPALSHQPRASEVTVEPKVADSSSQKKTMDFFNNKTCIDKRTKRTGSTNTDCELGFKLFFKTTTTKNDWSSIYTGRTLNHQLKNTCSLTTDVNGWGLFWNAIWSILC